MANKIQITSFLKKNTELGGWAFALLALYVMTPGESDISFCISSLLGLGRCPGCGIGHAIHDALHLQLARSVHHHFMGIPAVLIIFYRIKQLLLNSIKQHETQPD